jgi:UDP-N-acetyl-alpha-D-muramoyl-L-alanyl-L-glutamate epimerase
MDKFIELRKKYNTFRYIKYEIKDCVDVISIIYEYEIVDLSKFNHVINIEKKTIKNFRSYKDYVDEYESIIFNLGMLEIVNYIKLTCSYNIVVECGNLDEIQKEWFLNIYYNGLGEFRYINNIEIEKQDLFNIICTKYNLSKYNFRNNYVNDGNLIPVGGGKDSITTIELLKEFDNSYVILNPRGATISTINTIEKGFDNNTNIYRIIDSRLIELNKDFLNGHIPFSAMLAFLTYFLAFISSKKYVVLSNESSASEPNIPGTNINHQYSKSLEFENDFRDYVKKYLPLDIEYFSFLRPINELQIVKIFSKMKDYHKIFKSCNVGSKKDIWCCNCPKCLFVYIMLNLYLSQKEMIEIFGENLLNKKEMLQTFLELCGKSDNKPFECVGTFDDVNYAVVKYIKNNNELPYLLNYYKENYQLNINNELEYQYDSNNNLPKQFEKILKGEIFNDK